jgi:hypothetical protein
MLELVSCGLTGLASMLVVAFCVVCGEDAAILEESSGLLNKAKVSASPKIQTVTTNPRTARADRRPDVAKPSLLQTTSPLVQTGYHWDCRGTVKNGSCPAGGF